MTILESQIGRLPRAVKQVLLRRLAMAASVDPDGAPLELLGQDGESVFRGVVKRWGEKWGSRWWILDVRGPEGKMPTNRRTRDRLWYIWGSTLLYEAAGEAKYLDAAVHRREAPDRGDLRRIHERRELPAARQHGLPVGGGFRGVCRPFSRRSTADPRGGAGTVTLTVTNRGTRGTTFTVDLSAAGVHLDRGQLTVTLETGEARKAMIGMKAGDRVMPYLVRARIGGATVTTAVAEGRVAGTAPHG